MMVNETAKFENRTSSGQFLRVPSWCRRFSSHSARGYRVRRLVGTHEASSVLACGVTARSNQWSSGRL